MWIVRNTKLISGFARDESPSADRRQFLPYPRVIDLEISAVVRRTFDLSKIVYLDLFIIICEGIFFILVCKS